VAEIIAKDGHLDAVVHNATSALSPKPVTLADVAMHDLQDHVAVGARGLFLLATLAGPHLKASRGSFVILTSEAGFEGKALLAPYAAVKAAQRGMARALAREWGPQGVRVNCVAPLAMTPAMEEAFMSDPLMQSRVMGRNPLGRLGDPTEDIGPVVEFLLSGRAAFVTGNTLMVDGGSCPIS
jgi:3-oxoacyl-[acyl-carrier protein] reductase